MDASDRYAPMDAVTLFRYGLWGCQEQKEREKKRKEGRKGSYFPLGVEATHKKLKPFQEEEEVEAIRRRRRAAPFAAGVDIGMELKLNCASPAAYNIRQADNGAMAMGWMQSEQLQKCPTLPGRCRI